MKPRNAIKGLKKPFSNLSDSQFIEYDRLDPILSFSINWESDRLEKEWIRAQIHHNTNFGAKKRAKSRFWTLMLKYIPCMYHTQNIFITWQQKQEFWRELLPKSRNSFNLLRIRKRSYRDAKVKKLEQFWRENAVGIELCNECVLWWGVRFERLLAALKSKRHRHKVASFLAQACVGRLNW